MRNTMVKNVLEYGKTVVAVWENPVLLQELRHRVRGHRSWIILSAYLLLTSVPTVLIYLAFLSAMSRGPGIGEIGAVGKIIFYTVVFVTLTQVCVIAPSLTAGSITGEKERQTFDLLITTPLSSAQIILGKLIAALAYALLLIFAALPLASLSFLFGGVSATELLVSMLVILLTTILYATIGMLSSTLSRTTLGAMVRSQAAVVTFLMAIPFLMFILVGIAGFSVYGEPGAYAVALMLSSHPFIALGMTIMYLSRGENPWYQQFEGVPFLSPWIVYSILATAAALIFFILSVQRLDPFQVRPRRWRSIASLVVKR